MSIEIGYLFQSSGRNNPRSGTYTTAMLEVQHGEFYEHQIKVCTTGSSKDLGIKLFARNFNTVVQTLMI